ncbi:Fc.00g097960.m01.CDS01 [Cosmosporella sp. VM-42]
MSPLTREPYYLAGFNDLSIGYTLQSQSSSLLPVMDISSASTPDFHPKPGIYKARDLVRLTAPLLSAVLWKLGTDDTADRDVKEILVGGLAAALATSGRESTLPLSYYKQDTSRSEIARQAGRIGSTLVEYTRDATKFESSDPDLKLYSQCEGHLWTAEVANLLLGQRSSPHLMQLYNEWLHRMILLRDALLPFENYEEVPFVISTTSSQGLRDFEEPRKAFLVQCLIGRISQATIVNVAKVFTAKNLTSGGYGLQYSQGLILPAFLSSSSALHLLRYHPARIDDTQIDVLFDYEHPVYFNVDRTGLPEAEQSIPPGQWPNPSLLSLNPQVAKSSIGISPGIDSTSRTLRIELLFGDGNVVSVDIGQIARGHRYAYRYQGGREKEARRVSSRSSNEAEGAPLSTSPNTDGQEPTRSPEPVSQAKDRSTRIYLHDAAKILGLPGLITAGFWDCPDQLHILSARDPLVGLALLGKLYPENVVLLGEDDDPVSALETGKGFGARLVVLQRRRGTVDSSDSGYESPK